MDILSVFSAWDIVVLIAAMAGTQTIKATAKRHGAGDWIIMATPLVISILGIAAMAVAGLHEWTEVPLLGGVFGFGGNIIYKTYRKVVSR